MNDGAPETIPMAGQGAAGAALLAERRRQGLSLGDISRQLKLSVRQVEALERDDYSGFKSPVFIHGFIRNYAKLLGLDPNPLIKATDSMLAPPVAAAPAMLAEPAREPAQGAERKKFPALPVIVLLVIIGIALLAFGRRSHEPESAKLAASREKPVESPKASAEPKPVAEKPKAESRPEPEAVAKPTIRGEAKSAEGKPAEPKPNEPRPAAAKVPEARTAEAKPQPKTETVQRPAQESGVAVAAETGARITVRMVFEQDSWVEIKDRNGNTIFGQLNTSGSVRRVSGEPPLSVVVGNAAGVRLYQGDKSVDLGPHTRVDVARLTLE